MKIVLISTTQNPGDSFARFGVESLIREVDPEAEFILLDKENPESFENVPDFDRVIYAGQPLFWSHSEQTCSEIWWWDKIFRGWPSEDKRKFACIGVGNALGQDGIHNPNAYMAAIMEVIDRSALVTTRNPILGHPRLIESVCPAVFAEVPDASVLSRDVKRLCNLMRGGAHDPIFNRKEAALWDDNLKVVAEDLLERGYEFVAHSDDECDLAAELGWTGWTGVQIHFFRDHRDYLSLYQQCSEYVGNRLHGAMMAYMNQAMTTAIGYDSRCEMLARIGCKPQLPSEYIERGGNWSMTPLDYNLMAERNKLLTHLRGFLNDKADL